MGIHSKQSHYGSFTEQHQQKLSASRKMDFVVLAVRVAAAAAAAAKAQVNVGTEISKSSYSYSS